MENHSHRVIEYLESDARFPTGKIITRTRERKPNKHVINDKRENEEKAEEDMPEEEDNGRGNGKWHDAMRSEGSYTLSFPLFELIILARR